MEKCDYFNRKGKYLFTLTRGEPIPRGAWHNIAEIFVIDQQGNLFVTQRSLEKKLFPGFWEIPGGSVKSGESIFEGAKRELREESGIDVDVKTFKLLFKRRFVGRVHNYFFVKINQNDATFKMQEGETIGYEFATPSEIKLIIKQKKFSYTLVRGVKKFLRLQKKHLV